MTIGDIKIRVDFYCGKTTALSATDGLVALNNAVYEVETELLLSQGIWKYDDANNSNFPILTTSLVANQQDYSLPTETLKIDRIEISYDGTNWYRGTPTNITEHSKALTTTEINNAFDEEEPQYSILGRSLKLYPIPTSAVTGGLKLYGQRVHSAYTSSNYSAGTITLGFDVNFHDTVAKRMAIDYCLVNDMGRLANLKTLLNEDYSKMRVWNGLKTPDEKLAMMPAYESYE